MHKKVLLHCDLPAGLKYGHRTYVADWLRSGPVGSMLVGKLVHFGGFVWKKGLEKKNGLLLVAVKSATRSFKSATFFVIG